MTQTTQKYIDGNGVVFCEGKFATTYGKTAHGLVRFTRRYRIAAVIDSTLTGKDAGEIVDGKASGIPVVANLDEAFESARDRGTTLTHFIVGVATDGGVLDDDARAAVGEALEKGLNVDSGLHQFISDDARLTKIALSSGAVIRDIRKTPERSQLHFFSGKIEEVDSTRIAVLGTDSAIGKRTTSWLLVQGLEAAGYSAEMVGTGQTAWMQGAEYSIVLDSLVNDFISGELEHAVWSAWKKRKPDFIIIEGQGSLLNPAYPGGYEILAAGRPHGIVLQHAPARKVYDGFPDYPLHPLSKQRQVLEMVSERAVVAITINHEGIPRKDIPSVCASISDDTGLPCCDPLVEGIDAVLPAITAVRKE